MYVRILSPKRDVTFKIVIRLNPRIIFFHERGIPHLIVEGDAKQVPDAIQARGKIANMFGQLVDDVLLVLNSFPKWQIQHVNRDANKATHGLAKVAIT